LKQQLDAAAAKSMELEEEKDKWCEIVRDLEKRLKEKQAGRPRVMWR
jgi:hypothetical protein